MNDGGSLVNFGYVSGGSTAGFIYYHQGEQRFFSLWAEAENPAFFPHNCTICDSNKGLLLCHYPDPIPVNCLRHRRLHPYGKFKLTHRGNFLDLCNTIVRRYSYMVCNPFFRTYRRYIRNPPSELQAHRAHIPRVLIVDHLLVHPYLVFNIVCALPTASHTYSFQVYFSTKKRWKTFAPLPIGRIREDTGVSCGAMAYWLLDNAPVAIFYDTLDNTVGAVDLPDSYAALFRQPGIQLRSQLGKHGRKLCFVVAKEQWRAVYEASEHEEHDSVQWMCRHERTYAYRQLPMLSRFQDGRLQVPFWFDSRVLVIWDSRWEGLEPERTAYLRGPQRDLGTDILPLVYSVYDPIRHFRQSSSLADLCKCLIDEVLG